MFVLIKADNNGMICHDDCEGKTSAMVFEHYDDAFDEMASQVKKELIERDIEFATDVNGDIDRYDSGTYEIDDYFSYVDPYGDGPAWKIVEASPTERKPYIAHIMVPLSIYFRAKSEREANYVAETIVADTDRLHELLGKVFADSGSNAFLSDVVCDSDEDGYADITLDASEVRQILDEQDDYK